MEEDRLQELLREWKAPDPNTALDERVRATFRKLNPSFWRRLWTMRISIPVPAMAAILLLTAVVLWLGLRPSPPHAAAPPLDYANKVQAAGFQPLPNGAARIIEMKE
jgi:hypothetical protein